MANDDDIPYSRKEAIERGLPTYISKKPCKNGHRSKRRVDSCSCIECDHDNYIKNKKKVIEQCKVWRSNNIEKVRDRQRIMREENRDAYNAYLRDWGKKNRDKRTTYRRNWRSRNKDLTNSYTNNRRARNRSVEGSFTPDDINNIYKMQKGRCAYCRLKLNGKFEIDHIIPLTKSGTNFPKNIQLLCSRTKDGNACNQSKNNKDPIDYARSLGKLL